MTDISRLLTVDATAQNDGAVVYADRWNDAFKGSWIKTRSTNSAVFIETVERKIGEVLAKKAELKHLKRAERRRITITERARVRIEALVEVALIDAGGWEWGADTVDFERFKMLVQDPNCAPLAGLVIAMANSVGIADDEIEEDDAGNSQRPSAGSGDTAETTASSPA